ncbi:MAG: C4-dicarboxylate TRAP transporter large permease protein DctM [Verrucomicrobia subdivision 3 bacterium]|nr:C4-dicarboxylate TRAP transporter large permease protein DctM [Limisphaerales bacterium]MCS1413310.1 C4-dicarboxylate TRAP transporter large permease protein DctM [Limisphaerales bacterium]
MLVLLVSLGFFLLLGVPIAYSLGLSALSYFLIVQPELLQMLPQGLFAGMDSYTLIALPLFILMGQLMNEGGITRRLIDFCMMFAGRFHGGLGLVNVGASMLFGGISGSSTSDTASIGSVLIPEMKRRGYPQGFAAGLTVASSTMGMIIPPSIPMVLFAVTAQESVGRLFLGGMTPGIIVGGLQLLLVYGIARKRGYPQEAVSIQFRGVVKRVLSSAVVLVMPVFVVGTVVLGIATATESAGLGVVYAIAIGGFFIHHLTMSAFFEALRTAAVTSAKIMMIIAFSQVFIWVLALERAPQALTGFLQGVGLGPTGLLLLLVAVVLTIGTFVDVSPAILLLTPVFLPAVMAAGVSPILFGVVFVSGLAVGACTPPVGNCLNVCAVVSGLRIGEIFWGALPFLGANVLMLVLISLFPSLVLWLPNVLMGP